MLTGALAVVPVRGGEPATGGEEALAEAGGNGVLVGSGAESLAGQLRQRRMARALHPLEMPSFRPSDWAEMLGPIVSEASVVILPAAPDGRDLAPRLAAVLGWPLLASAIRVTAGWAALTRWQGRQIAWCEVVGPFVATLLPGSRSVPEPAADGGECVPGPSAEEKLGPAESAHVTPDAAHVTPDAAHVTPDAAPVTPGAPHVTPGTPHVKPPAAGVLPDDAYLEAPKVFGSHEAEVVQLLDADPAVMDLFEARRILAGGAGLGGVREFELLAQVAAALGALVGGTRVVTDAGILPHDRQIGTTGVSVRPRCYVAFGISGAAQHLGGLGSPEHVIAVNLDRSCPMMSMADLAIVADAPAVLRALAARLAPPGAEAG